MSSTPHNLDYAPRPPLHQRRIWRRAIYLLAAIMLLLSSYWWAPLAWRQARILYWQRQCMNYTAPADQIIVVGADGKSPARTSASPRCWAAFYNILSPPGFRSHATLFLHSRESHAGNQRLVAVDLASAEFQILHARVFQPATVISLPNEKPSVSRILPQIQIWKLSFRLYPGQPDPSDPSHFTIRCVTDDVESLIDGWLQDDDTVVLELRRAKPDW